MVNILVPTDFSDLSKIAIQYAVKAANKLDCSVTLLHVNLLVDPVHASMQAEAKRVEKEMTTEATERLTALVSEVSKKTKPLKPINFKVVTGPSFDEAVKKEAKREHADLIVMGTRGASGIKKYVIGSNTASLIGFSSLPVLAVPEEGAFKGLKNIIYASDLNHIDKELKALLPYVQKFDATLHIVHVVSAKKDSAAAEEKIDKAVQKAGYKNVVARVLVNRSVDTAIEDYELASRADMLAMFTHEKSFYDKLFNRSVTKKMAFQSKLPLLAFKHK